MIFLLGTLTFHTADGQQSRRGLDYVKQNPLWVYKAETENYQDGKLTTRTRTDYDRGKYRISEEAYGSMGPKKSLPPPIMTYIFANTRPPVLWTYDAQKRTATINVDSALYNFAWLANRDGAGAMKQRYYVPERLLKPELLRGRRSLLEVSFYVTRGLYIFLDPHEPYFARDYRKVGEETVAGQKCVIYQAARNDPSTRRYWVEPKSHLALKVEDIISSNPRAAPMHLVFVTKAIKFLPALPPERFQLPSGTTAILPEAMKDIPLPPGVMRQAMRGEAALLGFNPQTLFQPHQSSSGTEGGVGLAK